MDYAISFQIQTALILPVSNEIPLLCPLHVIAQALYHPLDELLVSQQLHGVQHRQQRFEEVHATLIHGDGAPAPAPQA